MNHKLLGHPLDSTGVITRWVLTITSILFFYMCQMHSRLFQEGLVTLKFPQGEEASSPQFGGTINTLGSEASGQLYRVFLLSLPGSP